MGINSNMVMGQFDNLEESFSISEIDPYVTEYMKPFATAMAVSLSGGWTHTAKVHSTLGFDITISGSYVKVPNSDLYFNVGDLDMPGYSFDPADGKAPTISAKNSFDPPNIIRPFQSTDAADIEFSGVQGLGLNFGGMAAIQAGVGLPKGTELIVRFVPDISKSANRVLNEVGDVELEKTGMWGLGVKHDIKQWIPVVSKVPFLQISGMFTYSRFYTGFAGDDVRFDPARFGSDVVSSLPESTWDNQKFKLGMSSFTGNLLVGANIPVFQPYIGLGFNSAKFKAGFEGNYPIIQGTNDGVFVNEFETDPVSIDAKATNFNFQAGARLKLGFFVFHYTFTAQKYKMHSGGIAFTFR